jgi:hypothetical protein
MHRLAQTGGHRLRIHPTQTKCVFAYVFHVCDADSLGSLMVSPSELSNAKLGVGKVAVANISSNGYHNFRNRPDPAVQ